MEITILSETRCLYGRKGQVPRVGVVSVDVVLVVGSLSTDLSIVIAEVVMATRQAVIKRYVLNILVVLYDYSDEGRRRELMIVQIQRTRMSRHS